MRKKAKENIKLKTPREYESQTHRFGYVLSLNIDKKKEDQQEDKVVDIIFFKKRKKRKKEKR